MSNAMTDAKCCHPTGGDAFPTTNPRVVILYEDILAGELGRQVARQFVGRDKARNCDIAAWDAALIDEPYFSHHIREQAANAEVIVIAIHGNSSFTQSLKRWVYH